MRENLDAMARKLGEMQARMMQIDSLGERVAGLAGLNPEEFKPAPAGAGGVLVGAHSMSMEALNGAMDDLNQLTGSRVDWLTVVESRLFDQQMQRNLIPTQEPVLGAKVGSPFGFRIDPITGKSALHTGLDFPADTGTPIFAAAGGVVVVQDEHHAYGNMIEVDHGNKLITRYAHASACFRQEGRHHQTWPEDRRSGLHGAIHRARICISRSGWQAWSRIPGAFSTLAKIWRLPNFATCASPEAPPRVATR